MAAVTFVTIGELTKWTVIRHWGPTSVARLGSLLDGLLVLPYDTRVAARWGELQAYASFEAGLDQSMTPGSPPAAWSASFP